MPEIPRIFDRELIARHLMRRPAGTDDFVSRLVEADLGERLRAVLRPIEHALLLAPVSAGFSTHSATASGPFTFARASTAMADDGEVLVDPEALALPRRDYDLIVSLFDLNVVNDVPGFLARARAHLKGDGLLLAAAIAGDSLTELREAFLAADSELSGGAFGRVAPFIQASEGGGLLQRAGLALPVADVETHIVRYPSPLKLMQELKALGAANPLFDRPGKPMTRRRLLRAAELYGDLASDPDGRVRGTLEILWLSGWAPHESQQKPLKPGSAKISLTKILGKPA